MGQPIWVGCEDNEYAEFGGGTVSTNSNFFRSSVSRCALGVDDSGAGWQSIQPYALTEFWMSARLMNSSSGSSFVDVTLLDFVDDHNVQRIRIQSPLITESSIPDFYWHVQKVDAAFNVTNLGNLMFLPISITAGKPDKIDIRMIYGSPGSIDIYQNGILVFNYIGDTTTDGQTTLAGHRLRCQGIGITYWSETWIDEDDTRSRSIVGFDPVANGHANTFDIGSPSVANITDIVNSDATLNGASSAGLIDQYTNGGVPSGTLDVIAVIVSARAQKGSSGPSKIALGVRTNSTDYWGSDQPQDVAWGNPQEVFATNPNTGVAWLKTEIGAALGFNVGSKSAT